MKKSGNKIGDKGRMSGGWTFNDGGGWSNIALNRGLRKKISGYLRRGMGDNLPTLVLAFDRHNLFVIGWRSGIIFF